MEELVERGVRRCSIVGREGCRLKSKGAQQKHEGS